MICMCKPFCDVDGAQMLDMTWLTQQCSQNIFETPCQIHISIQTIDHINNANIGLQSFHLWRPNDLSPPLLYNNPRRVRTNLDNSKGEWLLSTNFDPHIDETIFNF